MSALINLLPDLRQAKLKDLHRRQLVTAIAIAIWIACGSIIGVMVVISTSQIAVIGLVSKNITDKETSLGNVTGLVDALTAEQHLAALPALYSQRVYLTKFFTALTEADPNGVSLTSLNIDSSNILTVHGNAPSYSVTAKIARALAQSNVQVGTGAAPTNTPYFSDINLSNLEYNDKTGVGFTITATMAAGVTSGK